MFHDKDKEPKISSAHYSSPSSDVNLRPERDPGHVVSPLVTRLLLF